MRGYDPYTYRPLMRYFYNGGPNPADVSAMARADPGSRPYMNSVYQFTQWLKAAYPTVHNAVAANAPVMLSAPDVIASGAITPGARPLRRTALAGLGDITDGTPVTDWGKTIADLAKGVVQFAGQRDIIKLNITRAEQGLPPLDAGSVAPQVQVGMSPETAMMVKVGLGIAAVVGLSMSLAHARRGKR